MPLVGQQNRGLAPTSPPYHTPPTSPGVAQSSPNSEQYFTPPTSPRHRLSPSFATLPEEVLVHQILSILPWYDILSLRQTNKRLAQLTRHRAVWSSVLRNTLAHLEYYPRLKQLASSASLSDETFEGFVLSHIRAELGWRSRRLPLLKGISDDSETNTSFWGRAYVKVVEGGRWMLWSPPERDRLMVFDLHRWRLVEDVLIGPYQRNGQLLPLFEHVVVEVDRSAADLAFNIAFQWHNRIKPSALISKTASRLPSPELGPSIIEVHRVTQEGPEPDVMLVSTRISSFETQSDDAVLQTGLSLHGNYVARTWRHWDIYGGAYYTVEVFDWSLSTPDRKVKTVFSLRQTYVPIQIYLIPDNRLVVRNTTGLYVFDIPTAIHREGAPIGYPENIALPVARFIFPETCQRSVSDPHWDDDSTRFAILFSTGIYGLVIPRYSPTVNLDYELSCFQLSSFIPALDLKTIGCARVGINKAYIWPEGEKGFALSYVWPDKNGSRPKRRHTLHFIGSRDDRSVTNSSIGSTPHGWGHKWERMILAPHMDEFSGRLLAHVRNKGWGLIEFL